MPADRCARALAELELGRRRQHLEHLPAPARKRAALRRRAGVQLPTKLRQQIFSASGHLSRPDFSG